jgi:ABC-type oligopeptide transport system ATPase subunit
MKQGIYLIGFSVSGKSTVAKLIGAQLNWPAYDLDSIIAGKAIKSARSGKRIIKLLFLLMFFSAPLETLFLVKKTKLTNLFVPPSHWPSQVCACT